MNMDGFKIFEMPIIYQVENIKLYSFEYMELLYDIKCNVNWIETRYLMTPENPAPGCLEFYEFYKNKIILSIDNFIDINVSKLYIAETYNRYIGSDQGLVVDNISLNEIILSGSENIKSTTIEPIRRRS